jgi:hypothetical protein
VSDDYLDRLERHLEAYREDDDSECIDNPVAYRWLTVGDQRAAVAELKRLRAQVADFPEQLADAQEVALAKLVQAFEEGWDHCRLHLEEEARLKRGAAVTQYSNQLPWPAYPAEVAPESLEFPAAQDLRANKELHARCAHPAYEYATTRGPRKSWDGMNEPPEGDGWERNIDAGRPGEGWERFGYHEESYWRRLRPEASRQAGRELLARVRRGSDV